MNTHHPISADFRTALFRAPALVASILLAACGGGGDSPAGAPTVSSATATGANMQAVMYSRPLLITVNGENVNGGLSITSPACKAGPVLSTTAPYVSTASVAYYLCTVSKVGARQVNVARASDGVSLFTADFTVPVPVVRLTVENDLAVNGEMNITLAPDEAPKTVDNFLAYVNSGFYAGTVFHRVVAGFVIQGGGYLPIAPGIAPVVKTPLAAAIPLEAGLSNIQWTIAMARTDAPDSATSQFFINLVDNRPLLDIGGTSGGGLGFAVFGAVTMGTAVASTIVGAPCAPLAGFSECVPNPNVVITQARQIQ